MSVKVEKLEKSTAKLTIEVPFEEFDKAVNKAFNKQKNSINIPGFRKGKAPRQMIEKMYGKEVFYEEAINICINDTYPAAYDESGLDIVSQPEIGVEQVGADKPFIYTATVAVKPVVKLGEYKGIKVSKLDDSVSDEEVQADIDRTLAGQSREVVVDRAAADKDIVDIDFEGFVDGVAFDGGKGEKYPLTLGSHQFVDGFEDQIVGHVAGDEFDVNVTFPESYTPELAGKAATFKVKLNEVKTKELPILDDELVSDISEFENVADYKADVRKKLEEKKAEEVKRAQQEEALNKVVDASEMEIADAHIEAEIDRMMSDMSNRMAQQGLTMEQYMQFTGNTQESMREQARDSAISGIKSSAVLDAIAAAEQIEVSDEDAEAELKKMADMYGMDLDTLKGYFGGDGALDMMKRDLKPQKALDFITENMVVEKKAKAAKTTKTTKTTKEKKEAKKED